MKILFEGTEEQIKLLESEFEMLIIEHGDEELPTIRKDYQTKNLWSVKDVQSKFNCTDEAALLILENALTNEATMEQIWYAIESYSEVN